MTHRPQAPFATYPQRLTVLAAIMGLLALMGCGRADIDAVPGAPSGKTGVAAPSVEPQGQPELVDVKDAAAAQRAPSDRARPAAEVPVQSVPDPNGPKLTIRIDAGAGDDPITCVYLLDRDASTYKAFKNARSQAPPGAWDPIPRFGKLLTDPALRRHRLTVEIPRPPALSFIYARAGKMYGVETVKPKGEEPLVLKLDKVALDAQPVLVLRHSGEPAAGVKVRGTTLDSDGDPKKPKFDKSHPTGSDGVAMAYMLAEETDFVAQVIGADPAQATHEDERKGWRIQLPPMGRVRFSFPPDSKDVTVRLSGKQRWLRPLVASEKGAGPLEFAGLAAGIPFAYEAWVDDAYAEGDVPAIGQDGETVEVMPKLNVLRHIKMQLMRGGEPIAKGSKVVVTLSAPLSAPLGTPLGTPRRDARSKVLIGDPTDAEGRSSVLVDESEMAVTTQNHCEILVLPGTPRHAPGAQISLTLPVGEDDSPVIDLGVVDMDPLPLIVSGVVLDSGGGPVAGADLLIHRALPKRSESGSAPGEGGGPQMGGRMGGRIGADPKDPARADRAAARTDAAGKFELRGRGDPTLGGSFELFLRVKKRGYVDSRNVPFEPGATDAVVRLRRTGTMRVDPGKLDRSLARQLAGTLTHGTSGEQRSFGLTRAKDIKDLTAGTYGLAVRIGNFEVLSIDGLVVPEGGECADPRLHLSLDRLLGTRRLRVMGLEDSRAVTLFLTEDPAQGAAAHGIRSSEDWIEFPCPGLSPPRQFIAIPGRIPIEVTDLPNGSQVVPEPLLEITIRFEGAAAPAPLTELLLVPAHPIHRMVRGPESSIVVGLDGTATASVPGPGTYECAVVALDKTKDSPWGLSKITVDGRDAVVRAGQQTKR